MARCYPEVATALYREAGVRPSWTPLALVLVLHADRSPSEHALRAETHEPAGELPAARAEFWYERTGPQEPGAPTGLPLRGVRSGPLAAG